MNVRQIAYSSFNFNKRRTSTLSMQHAMYLTLVDVPRALNLVALIAGCPGFDSRADCNEKVLSPDLQVLTVREA